MDVLMTNPRKVEVGMDLLDFPTIIFYQIPMSTYTLRQASRRSWRIPQTKTGQSILSDVSRDSSDTADEFNGGQADIKSGVGRGAF